MDTSAKTELMLGTMIQVNEYMNMLHLVVRLLECWLTSTEKTLIVEMTDTDKNNANYVFFSYFFRFYNVKDFMSKMYTLILCDEITDTLSHLISLKVSFHKWYNVN